MLDVGCGVGHWGVLLASVMSGDVRVTGVEREPSWVEQARARAAALGLAGRFSYQQGEAERLPFPDDSFDLTTCQTVLIHLPDPAAAIAEMRRVTRPGGLVVVAEPNNLSERASPRFHLEPGGRRRGHGPGALPADLRARQGRARRG